MRSAELADRLGLSRVTLWRWERAGHLPPKRQVGPNVTGWLESELDRWFAERGNDHGWHGDREQEEWLEGSADS